MQSIGRIATELKLQLGARMMASSEDDHGQAKKSNASLKISKYSANVSKGSIQHFYIILTTEFKIFLCEKVKNVMNDNTFLYKLGNNPSTQLQKKRHTIVPQKSYHDTENKIKWQKSCKILGFKYN